MQKLNFGTRTRAKRLLEIIHTDVCGPITQVSHDEGKYFVTFIDDFSNFVWVYILKNKNEVFSCFKEYSKLVQTKFNCKISCLRCDNGREYILQDFKDYCQENGTFIDYTVPYTPQQNGKSERFNRILVEKARSMLYEANLPKEFWSEAILTAAYLYNRSPNAVNKLTPAEMWYGKKPNVSNLKVFGCTVFIHVPKELRSKFDYKSEKCIMMGYAKTGYRVWDIEKQRIVIARDVVFNEDNFIYKNNRVEFELELQENQIQRGIENEAEEKEEVEEREDIEENKQHDRGNIIQTRETEEVQTKRKIKIPSRYDDYEMYMAFDAMSYVHEIPKDVSELKGRSDESYWIRAMEKELKSIKENDTWTEENNSGDKEVLDTKWVFTTKPLELKKEDQYKARLVVRGFAQRSSFDHDSIYAPVAKMTTIRTLLVIGNQLSFYFRQLDVKTAFLNGKLMEDVYIYPPKGMECQPNVIFKLNKSLYGLKQSSKCWNDKINIFLLEMGFTRSEADFCLYSRCFHGSYTYLLIYVDDIILAGLNLDFINECIRKLNEKFSITDKGDLKYFLGLEITYDRSQGILKLSQERYLLQILKKFSFQDCKASEIPIDPKLKLNLEESSNKTRPVKELIGCLMYLMLGTRPDISFSINFFSRFQDNFSEEIWNYLKRILRYLKGTSKLCLTYERNQGCPLECFVDSDWGSDHVDRKSVSGHIIKIFGSVVGWTTKKQNCVALSTTEAELIALCGAVQDCLWYKRLLKDLNVVVGTFTVFEDNQGCIAILKNPGNIRRVKHIDLKFQFVSEMIKNKSVEIQYVQSKNQLADILTKGIAKNQFCLLRKSLGLA